MMYIFARKEKKVVGILLLCNLFEWGRIFKCLDYTGGVGVTITK